MYQNSKLCNNAADLRKPSMEVDWRVTQAALKTITTQNSTKWEEDPKEGNI